MSTRLLQIVSFVNVASAATVALPHNINVNGVAKKPDFVAADVGGFSIVVTATQVSVTNNNDAPASVNVWLELKHSIPRELGALSNLSPQPFVAAASGGGGGGGSIAVQEDEVAKGVFTTLDFNGAAAPSITDAGGGVASIFFPPAVTTPPSVGVEDEGNVLPNSPYPFLNFTGAGVTVTDNLSIAVINIPGAGSTGAGTGPSPLMATFGAFNMTTSSEYFDDIITDTLITKSKDAGGVTSIQHVDRRHAVGSERMLVAGTDGAWGTLLFGQVNGASVGGGFSLYQFADSPITSGIFEWRVSDSDGAPQNGDDWTSLIGMTQTDQPTVDNSQVAGFYFHANFARYGNGNWWAVMSDGAGGVVQADTGISLDFSWHRFTITYDATAQTLTFYIDGVQRAQLSTAVVIPTAYSPVVSIGNTQAGQSDQRDWFTDYFYGFVTLTRGTTF